MAFYLLQPNSTNGTQWQQWGSPRRGASLSGTCIMHTSESTLDKIGPDATAEDCARFIANRTGSYGSYHDLVDSDSIIEMAPFEYETWQDSETNPWAVGISAACRTTDWGNMPPEREEGFYRNLAWCAADFVKYMATKGITVPLKRISGQAARNREPGFCAHGDSGLYRTDPGANFDWTRFFNYTKQELDGIVPEKDDDKVLLIGRIPGTDAVWVGDGVVRRHITSVQALADLQWLGRQGHFKISNESNIADINELDALGRDIGTIAGQVLHSDIPWYGFHGKVPTEGRNTTTLSLQTGWIDTQLADMGRKLDAVQTPTFTAENLNTIVTQLKEALAPGLAAELAKRLAE